VDKLRKALIDDKIQSVTWATDALNNALAGFAQQGAVWDAISSVPHGESVIEFIDVNKYENHFTFQLRATRNEDRRDEVAQFVRGLTQALGVTGNKSKQWDNKALRVTWERPGVSVVLSEYRPPMCEMVTTEEYVEDPDAKFIDGKVLVIKRTTRLVCEPPQSDEVPF
jgi:hypothetical protein